MMNNSTSPKWLIIVEGSTDVITYERLLTHFNVSLTDINSLNIVSARTKQGVLNGELWDNIGIKHSSPLHNTLQKLIKHYVQQPNFKGIILIVDTDEQVSNPFSGYKRIVDSNLYTNSTATIPNDKNSYWELDYIKGNGKSIPIYGINVPAANMGCLETDLLNEFDFPIDGQAERANLENCIKTATDKWNVPKLGDGNYWWENNATSKMDKFIYGAFFHGFEISLNRNVDRSFLIPISEPAVIQRIKEIINLSV